MDLEAGDDTDCYWCTWNNPQRTGKGTARFRNQRTSRDHPHYSIIKISQNTEKCPGDLRRLAVTQAPVKNYQLNFVWKTLKGVKNNTQQNRKCWLCGHRH